MGRALGGKRRRGEKRDIKREWGNGVWSPSPCFIECQKHKLIGLGGMEGWEGREGGMEGSEKKGVEKKTSTLSSSLAPGSGVPTHPFLWLYVCVHAPATIPHPPTHPPLLPLLPPRPPCLQLLLPLASSMIKETAPADTTTMTHHG